MQATAALRLVAMNVGKGSTRPLSYRGGPDIISLSVVLPTARTPSA
jgi:hypothetical protein